LTHPTSVCSLVEQQLPLTTWTGGRRTVLVHSVRVNCFYES
jgi:hypothetical protein